MPLPRREVARQALQCRVDPIASTGLPDLVATCSGRPVQGRALTLHASRHWQSSEHRRPPGQHSMRDRTGCGTTASQEPHSCPTPAWAIRWDSSGQETRRGCRGCWQFGGSTVAPESTDTFYFPPELRCEPHRHTMEGFSAATAALFARPPTEHPFGAGHAFSRSCLLCG